MSISLGTEGKNIVIINKVYDSMEWRITSIYLGEKSTIRVESRGSQWALEPANKTLTTTQERKHAFCLHLLVHTPHLRPRPNELVPKKAIDWMDSHGKTWRKAGVKAGYLQVAWRMVKVQWGLQ